MKWENEESAEMLRRGREWMNKVELASFFVVSSSWRSRQLGGSTILPSSTAARIPTKS